MAKRKKHRLAIEFTVSSAISEADAVRGLQLLLDERLDMGKAPIWMHDRSPYAEKLTVKAWSRVIRASQGFLA